MGLLEHPEDTPFYDWVLTDSKESPYASFRFHYRTWENLHSLNLVSEELWTHCTLSRWYPRDGQLGRPDMMSTNRLLSASSDWGLFPKGRVEASNESKENHQQGANSTYNANDHSIGEQCRTIQQPAQQKVADFGHQYEMSYGHEGPQAQDVTRRSMEASAPSITSSLLPYAEEVPVNGDKVEYSTAKKVAVQCNLPQWQAFERPLPELPGMLPTPAPPSQEAGQPWPLLTVDGHEECHLKEHVRNSRTDNVYRQNRDSPTGAGNCQDFTSQSASVEAATNTMEVLSISEAEWIRGA